MNKQAAISTPILVTDCAREIKANCGTIWLLQKLESGFFIRCEIGAKQFIVVLPPITGENVALPVDRVPCHVVSSLAALKSWLQNFDPQQVF